MILLAFIMAASQGVGHPRISTDPEIQREYAKMPISAILAVFKKANCSPDEIEKLRKNEEIAPEKMAAIAKLLPIMRKIINETPQGGTVPKENWTISYCMAQACPLPQVKKDMMLELELMDLYSGYAKVSK